MPSRIDRRPRAPVLRSMAFRAMARRASSWKVRCRVFHLEQALVLLGQGVLRLGQDLHQGLLVEVLEGGDDRQTADEFWDQAVLQQILGLDLGQQLAGRLVLGRADVGAEADRRALAALADDLVQPGKGAADDEQDVGGIDLQELLLRMLAPALRRHGGDGAFHDLQQRLLHALARHVAGDRRVVGLAADLVDLVDVDDAALRPLDVVVGGLQQLEDDVLHVLADIARLGQGGGVGHGERHVEDAGQGLRQQGLAAAGRADEDDVRLRDFDVVVLPAAGVQALVVVVHGHRKHALGLLLADHVFVENLADVARGRYAVLRLHEVSLMFLANDVHAQLDAFVADEHGRTGDELAHFMLAFAAEGAIQSVL